MTKPTPLDLVLLAALFAAFAAGLVLVPEGASLPVHWGPSGAADAFLPKLPALAMPLVLAMLLWGIFAVIGRVAPDRLEAGRHIVTVALTGLTAIALAIEVVTVLTGLGIAVGMVQVLAIAVGLMFVVLGNVMPKSQPNGYAGLRLPTTLNDAANWRATHRVTGMLSMAGGAVLAVAALLVPASQLVWWFIACIVLPLAAGAAYSIARARRAARG